MKVIIDGYNLFHHVRSQTDPPESLILSTLLRELMAWAERSRNDVLAVFDGRRPKVIDESEFSKGRFRLVFVGSAHTADSAIMEFADTYSAPRNLMVVSTDREIRRHVKRRGCVAAVCEDFWAEVVALLNKPERPREPSVKQSGLATDGQRDYWLEFFGMDE